jgi:hypothetical protein
MTMTSPVIPVWLEWVLAIIAIGVLVAFALGVGLDWSP